MVPDGPKWRIWNSHCEVPELMAHFAQIDTSIVVPDHGHPVINVVVVVDTDCLDAGGNESEAVGIAFCKNLYGEETEWIQTSFNSTIREHFANRAMYYDPSIDCFKNERQLVSHVWRALEDGLTAWAPPHDPPDGPLGGSDYVWSEDQLDWVPAEPIIRSIPFPSWTLVDGHATAPVPPPSDASWDKPYEWDEENQSWVLPI